MAASSPYTVVLDARVHYLDDEGIVAAANTIYPGQLVAWSSGEVIRHATAADTAIQIMFAVENGQDMLGRGIDDAYVAGATCYFYHAHRGARIYAFLETAGNVAKGAPLEASGTGSLQAHTTGQVVAWADEAVNNSGGGTGPDGSARIRVRAA
jgi:hypothetical protein